MLTTGAWFVLVLLFILVVMLLNFYVTNTTNVMYCYTFNYFKNKTLSSVLSPHNRVFMVVC